MRAFLIRRSSISLAICGIAAVLMFYVVNYPVSYTHLTLPTKLEV